MTDIAIHIKDLNLYYTKFHAVKDVNIDFKSNQITALIGPSGCGKSTLLRTLNRINDTIEGVRITGDVVINGYNIYAEGADVDRIRRNVGMVFQRPNPFPLSVYDNVAFGLQINRIVKSKSETDQIVKESLEDVELWNDLKDKLKSNALSLSLEQQQRLCIARVVAVKPQVILLDEPCSSLDPMATAHIEELMQELKEKYTIVIVTHNMQQAARISKETGYMLLGKLIEFDKTEKIFTNPSQKETEDYVSGRFG
ncbi:MAG: phosphate ABC transporter ATP-binding protein PstB [Endomicrobiaceae bacterium]|jgi:phosphate transport system ATP-binding protein|nr:phosphate ABC transporter ATP-binding protein PstB [Endomicrobiaceae bacterium]MDD3729773.1 phosphate ABC transporter ATP-binding protein PstB [Endomicrobiaceae bacterium]MDD4166021.1 phosphate ABC transporter ATP-binding protein PstB [Endomicrobiaceae bacterium]